MVKLREVIDLINVDGDKFIYIVKPGRPTCEYEYEDDVISDLLEDTVTSIDIYDSSVYITLVGQE